MDEWNGPTPSLQDIVAAENHLFPDMPDFAEPGWRMWTDEEVERINELAQAIMERPLGGPAPS